MIVIDASIVAAMLIDDEPPLPDDIVARLADEPLIAPAHWPLETANMLHMAARRRRIDRVSRDVALRFVRQLGVALAADEIDRAWSDVSRLADAHHVTIYAAAYLDLAIRRHAALATLDRALATAALACSVEVLTYA